MEWLTWFEIFISAIAVYLTYMCWHFRLFYKQGISMSRRPVPVFGTVLAFFQDGPVKMFEGTIDKLGLTWGDFNIRTPVLTTCDTDIIRTVYIKDRATFHARNHLTTGVEMTDAMLSNVTDYDHWKYLRSVMSPTFSSGKLKRMMKQINKCAQQFCLHIIEKSQNNQSIEMKQHAGTFTMDVIGSTAFGLDINSAQDENSDFVKYAKKAFEFKPNSPFLILVFFFPFLTKYLGLLRIPVMDQGVVDFFTETIKRTIEARKGDEDRTDFLQLMMNAHKDQEDNDVAEDGIQLDKPKRGLTQGELLAQGLLFFLAGYDTTATSISFLAYNLATNPQEQEKLIEEIDRVIGDKEEVTDKDLQEMPYLDMCVNESLRLYPPATLTERCAFKDVELKGIKLPKYSHIRVPVYHIHHHERFYPNPEAFNPERFSNEEKSKRDPLLFMPFGAGPRKCIATRLALIEIKVAISLLLKSHKFVKAPETEIPIKFAKAGLLKAENGVWLRIEKR